MARKPVIILYSECLSSYLLYSELIKNHSELFSCLIKLPAIPRQDKNSSTKRFSMIVRILKKSSLGYILINFCTILLYRTIATIFRRRLSDLAKSLGIPVFYSKAADEQLVDKIKSFRPAWILNNSPNILKKDILSIPSKGTLNYHCAPLPKYRGAANYFWVLFNKEPTTRATLHYVIERLDAGNIILTSPDIPIKTNMAVFRLWYEGRITAYHSFKKILDYLSESKLIPARKQDESQAQLRSFPGKDVTVTLRKHGHKVLNFNDLWTIIKIAITGKIYKN